MKKMIPVYLLQIAMLATVLIVGLKVLQEVRAFRAELAADVSTMTDVGVRKPRGAPAIRVSVVNPVEITR